MGAKEKLGKALIDFNNFVKPHMPCIGKVIKVPPELEISIFNNQVILDKDNLYMNDRLFNDHTRLYKCEDGVFDEIKVEGNIENTISSSKMSSSGQGPHTHNVTSTKGTTKVEGSGSYKVNGTIVLTDTLKVGDLVKVTPTENMQIWFVDYKVRKIGGG